MEAKHTKGEIRNARIESTSLTIADHSCLSAWLHLDYGGSGQGFGGYALDEWTPAKNKRVGTAWGCEYLRRILEVLEVPTWEQLPGKLIRARCDHGEVYAIGHPLKDVWFSPEDLLADFKAVPHD